jgi:hypothetical protein
MTTDNTEFEREKAKLEQEKADFERDKLRDEIIRQIRAEEEAKKNARGGFLWFLKPHRVVQRGYYGLKDVAMAGYEGAASIPRSTINDYKEAKIQYANASLRERAVFLWESIVWGVAFTVSILLWILVHKLYGMIPGAILGLMWMLRKRKDFVREFIESNLVEEKDETLRDGESRYSVNSEAFKEISVVRLEHVAEAITRWKLHKGMERVDLAPIYAAEIMSHMTGVIPVYDEDQIVERKAPTEESAALEPKNAERTSGNSSEPQPVESLETPAPQGDGHSTTQDSSPGPSSTAPSAQKPGEAP